MAQPSIEDRSIDISRLPAIRLQDFPVPTALHLPSLWVHLVMLALCLASPRP